ncbi:MAG: ImmA/IrrE family metallo-endopeptidase [Candidatus Peregrinibacteria bacterium]|nr:ImmA/IrrE family metallo-endopeptidase [Candidatus Peregrinibacteria bacterium]MCB9807808.1 ImmA/IrrE family metallo-endopeptidase [Candidatus Peribacteria bacterium]
MPKRPNVIIKPDILRWARTSIHLSEEEVVEHFSKKTKLKFNINLDALKSLEKNEQAIAFSLLKELAALYKRPLAVFFLEKPLKEKPLPKDRRTLGSEVNISFSRDGILVARKARRIQEVTAELYKSLKIDFKFPFKKYGSSDNAESVADTIRKKLGFTIETQRSFRNSNELFAHLRELIEGMGIVTLKQPFPIEDARAFSLTDQEPYVIVINSKDGGLNYAPKAFSLMHEFAHLLLREGAICNDFYHSHKSIESFCNQFSASFLVPKKEFIVEHQRIAENNDDLDEQLKQLHKVFKVSHHALLRRYESCQLISNRFYQKKVSEWEKDFAESYSLGTGFVPPQKPHKKAYVNNGKLFTNLVLQAHYENVIGYDAVSDYLDVKMKHIPSLEDFAHSKT